MRIYFTASESASDDESFTHSKIISHLNKKGYKVFARVNKGQSLKPTQMTANELNQWYDSYKDWSSCTQNADVAIVEGRVPLKMHTVSI